MAPWIPIIVGLVVAMFVLWANEYRAIRRDRAIRVEAWRGYYRDQLRGLHVRWTEDDITKMARSRMR